MAFEYLLSALLLRYACSNEGSNFHCQIPRLQIALTSFKFYKRHKYSSSEIMSKFHSTLFCCNEPCRHARAQHYTSYIYTVAKCHTKSSRSTVWFLIKRSPDALSILEGICCEELKKKVSTRHVKLNSQHSKSRLDSGECIP